MSLVESFARFDHVLRPWLLRLPPATVVRLLSQGRLTFLHRFVRDAPGKHTIAEARGIRLWDKDFRMPLWNAAGMFKKGEAYQLVARQGAGAYVAGTTTSRPREGNLRDGIRWPVATYPRSGAASNWMGLPNEGHAVVAARLATQDHIAGCPMVASVSAEPGLDETLALPELVEGIRQYEAAGVDIIELNESCPNVPGHHGPTLDDGLVRRLEYVREHVLLRRTRNMPVVVKFSTDTDVKQVEELVRLLVTLGYDGVILGNTSTQYQRIRERLHIDELRVFDYFTATFGGGVSGRPLKEASLALCVEARRVVDVIRPAQEFHVIRTGGVETADDVLASRRAGIVANQWFSGYFEAFGRHGHDLYTVLADRLA